MDIQELDDWLASRPVGDAAVIAHRAALRVFPLLFRDLVRSWAQDFGVVSLPFLRAILSVGVMRRFPTPDVWAATIMAYNAAERAASVGIDEVRGSDPNRVSFTNVAASFALAIDAVLSDGAAARTAAASCVEETDRAILWSTYRDGQDDIATEAGWLEVKLDTDALQTGIDLGPAAIWSIFPADQLGWLEQNGLQKLTGETGSEASFWHRWWAGAKTGHWLDWELQREITLIPDGIWAQGHAAVAEAIRLIEERLELRGQVAALRQGLEGAKAEIAELANAMQRSHNNPPELVDTLSWSPATVGTLADDLARVEAELAGPAPDPEVLGQKGGAIKATALQVLKYIGGLADLAARTATEELAKTGMKVAIGIAAAEHLSGLVPLLKQARDLGQMLLDFAAALMGG